MPSSITGLVLFVLLLAPGFVSLLVSERGRVAGRETTVLRETSTIALSSVAFNVTAAFLIAAALRVTALDGPNLRKLAEKDGLYLRDHWLGTGGWLLLVVVVGCLCAIAWAGAMNRTNGFGGLFSKRPLRWLFPPNGGTEYVSAWWKLLIDPSIHPEMDRYVTCNLDDDTSVSGWLYSASHEAKEGPERELILSAPLVIRDGQGVEVTVDTGAVAISASHLRYLYVRYASRTA